MKLVTAVVNIIDIKIHIALKHKKWINGLMD
jgi:hypothetical protein